MDRFLDTLALVLWALVFIVPIAAIVISWRYKQAKWYYRLLVGLFVGSVISVLLFWLGLTLIFRHGIEIW